MKVKTSDLSGDALDWAVAKCEGKYVLERPSFAAFHSIGAMNFSTDWAQGGPIIEREILAPEPLLDTNCALIKWRCRNWKGDGSDFYGPTPLIAAMRCYCCSKLGDEVDVPEELA